MQAASNLNSFQQMELDELHDLFEILGIDPDSTDFLASEMPEEVQQRFKINDIDGLNWALRKMAALKALQTKHDELRDAEIARVQEWHVKLSRGNQQSIEFFNRLVQQYAAECRAVDPKYKGEKTPYGKVGFRKQQPEWSYQDEAATVSFLEANDYNGLVKVDKKISSKTDFKKAFDVKANVFVKDGEVVDVATEIVEVGDVARYRGIQFIAERVGDVLRVVTNEAEIVDDVQFMNMAAIDRMTDKVVPGVAVYERPDAIDVKTEV